MSVVPAGYERYPCADYFSSVWAERGFWCEDSQLDVIVPAAEVRELAPIGFLAIGRAGVDGILFGYRTGEPGLWTYYPIGQGFEPLAVDVAQFVERWQTGGIKI